MAQAQPAIAVTSRIDKLNVAASLHQFDRALNRSAWESLGWGAFSAVIGLVLLSTTAHFGWVNLAFGVLLIAEGLYEKKVREPKVILVSAATLGVLGLWNLYGFVMNIVSNSGVVGHPVVAILQLVGAWNTYAGYSKYAALVAAADPATNMEFATMLDQLRTADPATAPDMVEFTAQKFGKNNVRWRARRMATDDLIFFVGNEVVLGRKQSTPTCLFVPRQQVKIEILGEKMFGRNQKATITAAAQQWKASIAPEMAQKFMTLLG
ncbi:MAG TPA: hypothetical protein VHN74_19235 [Candidatus Angelobacter sp.]|nr:hypothetical protein [Candidatus Angelobacter sp.]